MKINQEASRFRKAFILVYECDGCGHSYTEQGWNEPHYVLNVVPKMECPKCGMDEHDIELEKSKCEAEALGQEGDL